MNEQSVVEAGKNLMGADPVLGSVIVLLLSAVIFLVAWIRSLLKENSAAKQSHLEDVRKYASEIEAVKTIIASNTEQIRVNTEAMRTMIEIYRERLRA